jgi:UDP:flavonoid glycosyltransferase YjiC (YdhE family)
VTDLVGPLVAATLGTPHAVLAWSPPLPAEFVSAMAELAAEQYTQRGLTPSAPIAVINLCPPALRGPGFVAPPHHLPMRPEAPRRARSYLDLPRPDRGRPAVLVALGRVPDDVLARTVRALDPDRLDVRVDVRPGAAADGVGDVDPGMRGLTRAPWDDLVDGADVVVGTGEAGALLGALAHGRPMVLLPQGEDQPWHAARAAAAGAALVVGAPREVGPAVARVLGDPSFRDAARSVRTQIARMPMPTAVVTAVVTALRELSPSRHPERPSRARGRRPQYA